MMSSVAVVMCQCGLFYQASATETPALAPLLWVLGRNQLAPGRKKLNTSCRYLPHLMEDILVILTEYIKDKMRNERFSTQEG